MAVKEKKEKTKTKSTSKETVVEKIESIENSTTVESTEISDQKIKPPREATITISLIENPVNIEDKIFNAILRVEQLIQSDTAISREDMYDLGEGLERKLEEILPNWINFEWMYITPELQQQLDSWCSDWSDFIMEFARKNLLHIFHIEEEGVKYPFNNKVIKKNLDRKQLQIIGDYIVAQEMGIWWDKKKIRLRLYWRTLDEWADIIYEWSIKTGRAASADRVMTLIDIQETGQPWSTIPIEDLKRIFEIMKNKGYIEWADKKKTSIAFIF